MDCKFFFKLLHLIGHLTSSEYLLTFFAYCAKMLLLFDISNSSHWLIAPSVTFLCELLNAIGKDLGMCGNQCEGGNVSGAEGGRERDEVCLCATPGEGWLGCTPPPPRTARMGAGGTEATGPGLSAGEGCQGGPADGDPAQAGHSPQPRTHARFDLTGKTVSPLQESYELSESVLLFYGYSLRGIVLNINQ